MADRASKTDFAPNMMFEMTAKILEPCTVDLISICCSAWIFTGCILIKLLPPVLILYQPTGPPLHVADLNYGSRIHSLAVQVLPGSVTLFCAQHVGERAPNEGPNARLQIHLSANVGNMSKMPMKNAYVPARPRRSQNCTFALDYPATLSADLKTVISPLVVKDC